jgi:membrane associated rhomboid family serine protease
MGIYDRDYVRREGPSFLGSFVERGRVCRWLVGINVAVFIVQILTLPTGHGEDMGRFTNALVLNTGDVLHGQVWRLLTYAFLHDPWSIWHILLNMLFLWWFGSDVEDLYGPREFLAFYLTAAFVGGLAFFVSALVWMPGDKPAVCLGASGAVNAALVLCAIHYPRRIIYLFFFLPVPIWLFIAVVLAGDAFVFLHRAESGTAVAAHLAGALFAAVYYKQHWKLLNWWPDLRGWRRQLFRPRLRVYREEDTAPSRAERVPVSVPASAPLDDEQLEAKMDAILEKISKVGKDNLTESERQLLLRASEVFRRRRT